MIDKKRIEDEAQHFFEWPDPKHRDTVTLTSCVIFAATIAEMVNAENIGRGEKLADELRAEIKRLQDMLFARGAMAEAPCFCCGYSGPGYFQVESHPCAERHLLSMDEEA